MPTGSRAADLSAKLPKLKLTKRDKERAEAAQKFLLLDPEAIPDELLIATVLLGTLPGDPVETASQILDAHDHNLSRVMRAEVFELLGLGSEAKARMAAASEISRRAALRAALESKSPKVTSAEEAVVWMRTRAEGVNERMVALYLNISGRVIAFRTLTQGSPRYTIVDPLQVLQPAIALGATNMILSHQHPSGEASPSSQDRDVTRRVANAGRIVGVTLLDHIIVTPTNFYSFSEHGELERKPGYGAAESWTA